MLDLFSSEQTRFADSYTINKLAIPQALLMEHAALAGLARIRHRFGSAAMVDLRCLIVAGSGNNGGDALALGRLLLLEGCRELSIVSPRGKKSRGYSFQLELLKKMKAKIRTEFPLVPGSNGTAGSKGYDLIVDGLFGTGLNRTLSPEMRQWVEKINSLHGKSWVLSLDIPSGLNADTGLSWGATVIASETVTFGALKKGLFTGVAANYVGELTLDRILIPRQIPGLKAVDFLVEPGDVVLPVRQPASHKGNHGRVLVAAGAANTEGAAVLSALGALRTGAGWVTIVSEDGAGNTSTLAQLRSRLPPEIMTKVLDRSFFHENQTLVVGPGMATDCKDSDDDQGMRRLQQVLGSGSSCVLDAGALTILGRSRQPLAEALKNRTAPLVLTPHPGEAAGLLGVSVEQVQSDRYLSARKIASLYRAVCVLKGKGSVIACSSEKFTYVVDRGNSALAKGGSGDVLSGMIGALLSQGLDAKSAAITGAFLHGIAAERMAQTFGEAYSPLASELTEFIGLAIEELSMMGSGTGLTGRRR